MTTGEKDTPTATEGEEQGAHTMPRLPLPGMSGMPAMPAGTAGRVLWWGGLAALAAFDVVEWPVAVVVGAGSWVAEQYAKAGVREEQRDDQRQAAPPMPAQRTASPS